MNEFSKGQQLYLRRLRRHHRIVIISRVLILILFLLLWEITANTGLIDSFIFSSPSRVAECFWEMVIDKTIFLHIGVTLYEIIVSFLLVTFFSILIAVILWYSRKLSEILDPYLVVLNSLPKSALAPLLIVWLGANETTIIVAGMSVAIFGSILNLYTSFTSIDEEKIKLIYTLRGTKRHVLSKVILPGSIPVIISNMKVNIGLSLVGVIAGEFLVSKAGLGYLIVYGGQVFQLDLVMASVVVLCVLAALMYYAVAAVEKRLTR